MSSTCLPHVGTNAPRKLIVCVQAVWDSEEVSASTFEFQDSSCNTVLIGCDNGDVTVADVRSQRLVCLIMTI